MTDQTTPHAGNLAGYSPSAGNTAGEHYEYPTGFSPKANLNGIETPRGKAAQYGELGFATTNTTMTDDEIAADAVDVERSKLMVIGEFGFVMHMLRSDQFWDKMDANFGQSDGVIKEFLTQARKDFTSAGDGLDISDIVNADSGKLSADDLTKIAEAVGKVSGKRTNFVVNRSTGGEYTSANENDGPPQAHPGFMHVPAKPAPIDPSRFTPATDYTGEQEARANAASGRSSISI